MDSLNFYLKISKRLMNKMLCSKWGVWYKQSSKLNIFEVKFLLITYLECEFLYLT